MRNAILLAALLVSALTVSSCKKKKYDNSKAPITNAIVEIAFDEMTNMSDQAITGNMIFYKSGKVTVLNAEHLSDVAIDKAACNVVITLDTAGSTKTVTIDWGNTNCDCNDGKQRRGKIVTTFTGSYYAQGTVITHTPVDYYVNNHHIEGSKTITNMGLNNNGQPYYNISINGLVTLSTGEIVTYTSNRVRTFTAGFNTYLNFWDDEYDITGTANASVVNGDGYEAHTTAPLHVKVGCGYIMSGTLEITPTGKPVRVIDYGPGTCDATFTITINGQTYTIN